MLHMHISVTLSINFKSATKIQKNLIRKKKNQFFFVLFVKTQMGTGKELVLRNGRRNVVQVGFPMVEER